MTIFVPEDFMTIEEKIAEGLWPSEWCSTNKVAPYISRMKGELVGVDIGTGRGEHVYHLLTKCPNISLLYTIDHYLEHDNWNGKVEQKDQDSFKDIAQKNLERFGKRVKQYIGDSISESKRFANEYFDFVFIDGDVALDAVVNDLTAYYPKLKKNGLICGHNFQFSTVHDAIKKFRSDNKINTPPITRIGSTGWFWKKS